MPQAAPCGITKVGKFHSFNLLKSSFGVLVNSLQSLGKSLTSTPSGQTLSIILEEA